MKRERQRFTALYLHRIVDRETTTFILKCRIERGLSSNKRPSSQTCTHTPGWKEIMMIRHLESRQHTFAYTQTKRLLPLRHVARSHLRKVVWRAGLLSGVAQSAAVQFRVIRGIAGPNVVAALSA
jgi:hypothetical protein